MDGTTMLTTNAEQPEPMTPRDSVQIDVGTALEKARWFIGVIWIDPAEEEGQSPTIQCRLSMQNYAHGDFAASIRLLKQKCDDILLRESQSSYAEPVPLPTPEESDDG